MNMNEKFLVVGLCVVVFVIILAILLAVVIEKDIKNTREQFRKDRNAKIDAKRKTLASQMDQLYWRYTEKGFAPSLVKEEFNKLFLEYQALGSVDDYVDLRDSFLTLPENK